MIKQRILVLDIETSPLIAYTWGRKDVNIGLTMIKTESYVIAWAAKWLGEKPSKTVYRDLSINKDEKAILRPLWHMLDEAAIVVTQNGKNFDIPTLNGRFIMHGIPPYSPVEHLDTYQIARRAAKLTSYKLEYLTDKLNVKYKKLKHSKYPGMELWKECLAGNKDAWKEMKRYNIHDVLSTEELYLKLRAWAPKSAPHPYAFAGVTECRMCGKKECLQARGYGASKTGQYKRFQCMACGTWTNGQTFKEAA